MKSFGSLTTLAFFFACSSLSAQKKSVSGYYIAQQGDTVRGIFPKYAQWNKNPSRVDFIMDGTGNQLQLTPENTRKFVIEGYDEYISFTGNRLVNPIRDAVVIDEQSFVNQKDSSQQVSTFLRLVKRTKGGDLYVLNDALRTNFFYHLPGREVIELRYKKTFINNQVLEVADFRKQLNGLFAEIVLQKKLVSKLEKLGYSEFELSSFLDRLFPAPNQGGRKSGRATEWVVAGGVVLNNVRVLADKDFTYIPKNYRSSVSPLLSIGPVIPMGRNFGKYFFNPQVKLFRYENTSEEEQGTAMIKTVTFQADLVVVAQIGLGVNLVNSGNQRIFIGGGFGSLAQLGAKKRHGWYSSPDRSYVSGNESKLPELSYSMEVSAGVDLNKKVLLSASYMLPAPIGNFVFYHPQLSGIQLRVGYKL